MNSTQVSASDYIYYCEDKKLYLRYGNKNSKHSKDLLIKSLTSELYVNGWALEVVLLRHWANKEPKDFNIVLASTHLIKTLLVYFLLSIWLKIKLELCTLLCDGYRRKGIASMMIEFANLKIYQ